jgi:hypothetical protein
MVDHVIELAEQHQASVVALKALAKGLGPIGTVLVKIDSAEVVIEVVPFLDCYIVANGADVHTASQSNHRRTPHPHFGSHTVRVPSELAFDTT